MAEEIDLALGSFSVREGPISLAAHVAEVLAAAGYGKLEEAWDEGLDAGRDRWLDFREFGDKPVNPYRRPE